jgi:hypothetical protein
MLALVYHETWCHILILLFKMVVFWEYYSSLRSFIGCQPKPLLYFLYWTFCRKGIRSQFLGTLINQACREYPVGLDGPYSSATIRFRLNFFTAVRANLPLSFKRSTAIFARSLNFCWGSRSSPGWYGSSRGNSSLCAPASY